MKRYILNFGSSNGRFFSALRNRNGNWTVDTLQAVPIAGGRTKLTLM
jgi:hypothetical protein